MSKVKTTKKAIVNAFGRIIYVGYCNLQSVLDRYNATFYTAGVYGWNADVYYIDNNTVICTGYRTFGNINGNDIAKKYEQLGRKLNDKYSWLEYERKEKVRKYLLARFVRACLAL